jgi:hypothetical protein
MKSQLITVGGTDAVPTFTGAEAKLLDIATTAVSTDKALTGMYGLAQKALFVGAGMAIQSKRKLGTWNPI